MPSIKDLKKRIGSTKTTQQTTKAMKMVSAAKLRRAQDAIQGNKPYAQELSNLMGMVTPLVGQGFKSDLIERGEQLAKNDRKILLIIVTSDRGLCGGFNSNVIRFAQRWMKGEGLEYGSVTFGFLGKKANDILKTRKNAGPYFERYGGKVTFQKAREMAGELVQLYLNREYDEVYFLFNEFKNAVTQKVTLERFLPFSSNSTKSVDSSEMVIVKPDAKEILERLLGKIFAVKLFRIMLDSQAGEHGARMAAMENATKNAGEMIRKLTLQYNKQRQAGITKELLEIIAGSESQKN